ncbi:MAG: hypothetical protein Q8P18_26100 [Pseudomonadota bacterium]|nr:hypothetical protein [Pseudomonadota bacterium]
MRAALVLLALAGCAQYRTYPLLTLEGPGHAPLEPTGIAVLEDGSIVAIAEGDARALLVPVPDRVEDRGSALTIFPLTDGRDGCDDPSCAARAYRASVRLREQPIRWLARERRVNIPYNVQDLAPFGKDRVIGVTEYTTIGRRTGYQKDYVARPRQQTERLFVLERRGDAWQEIDLPEIEALRGVLSDWGRANCDADMLVGGLAWDPVDERVYVGLRRCAGPAARVLGWNLGSARLGRATDLTVVADGVAGATAGPEEGVSALCFAEGRLWALTAWDSYGFDVEPAFGGRLHEVHDGSLHPVDLPGPFVDRPAALAVLDSGNRRDGLDAIVLFDNDADSRSRPDLTVLQARTPRPRDERYAELVDIQEQPDPLPLGLNGFDFRWWVRDHRLSHLAAVLDRKFNVDGTSTFGAWTRALGGLWQIRVGGSAGLASRWLPGGARIGHNKQAVAFTDYSKTKLEFTRYRARISVIPRDRIRRDASTAGLLGDNREAWRVTVQLPEPVPGAGLVLQGFEIDTSSRADRGICLAAMDLGVDWHSEARDAVDLQATLIGGLCNDFDYRGPDYFHGLTTEVEGGVLVTLHYAVVRGAESAAWSVGLYDRDVPRSPGATADATLEDMDDESSRAHLHCARVSPDGTVATLPRQADAPPADWLSQGMLLDGTVGVGAASLRGFALALDPAGFDPVTGPRPLTEEESMDRNNYIYRYLLRALPDANGTFIEGGMTHGIHARGPMRDNARPSALALRVDLTSFPTLPGAVANDITWPRRVDDPNLLPEDGYVRWSQTHPADPEPACSPSW